MKICPLITQASILEEDEKDLLLREADSNDLCGKTDAEPPGEQQGEDIFINPDVDASDTPLEEELDMPGRSVRFLAKSFRGEVECLGELCRFHDDGNETCRFDALLGMIEKSEETSNGELESIRMEIEKSWEFQQKSTSELVGLFHELENNNNKLQETLGDKFDGKLEEINRMISSVMDEQKVVIESISDTLAEKTEEIEERIESSDKNMESFREEISDWKGILDKNIDAFDSELQRHKKIVEDLSNNHSEMLTIMENQKRNLEEEEKKRQTAEAKRLNNTGVIAYHNGHYEKALELFNQAIEMDGEFTEAYNNLGLIYTEMNEEEKATEAFKKAIDLNPGLSATYNNLGYVFYRTGSYLEAIEMYNEAIGRSSDNSSAYTNLGNAYYKLDRIDEAIEAWTNAVKIDPGNEKARRNLKRFNAEVKE
jgi:tetratricopeptide (TPR) repeat protein